ncbi:MAG: hypothetical protein SH850_30250 [Planctomycetaceae bacterium]|nr:hypothetical protein [Planctomycetaceae bacterium]
MGRAIVVMVSTLLFGSFGLFVGWLNVQAVLTDTNTSNRRNEMIMLSYSFGPLLGAAIGFAMSLAVVYLFAPPRKNG